LNFERLTPRWITTREAEDALCTSRSTLMRMIDEGRLTFGVHYRKGPGKRGRLSWNVQEIEKVLNTPHAATTTPE
jgi:hypothetical protein